MVLRKDASSNMHLSLPGSQDRGLHTVEGISQVLGPKCDSGSEGWDWLKQLYGHGVPDGVASLVPL